MCLVLSKDPELLIAKEDIRVFKYVSIVLESINKVQSYYYFKIYDRGEIYKDTLGPLRYNNTLGLYVIERAYHSFSLDIEHSVTCGNIIIGTPNTPNCIVCPIHVDRGLSICIALFTVPKGSEFYYEDGVIASRAIRYEGIYARIFTKDDFDRFLKYFQNVRLSR